jgi:hypothetical protein
MFSLGAVWGQVRDALIAALPASSLQLQTRLAALAVFVHRYGPLAAFKVQWPADLDAPVPYFSVAVDMSFSMDLSPRPALDPHALKLGAPQLEKLLFFSSAKDAQVLLGLQVFAGYTEPTSATASTVDQLAKGTRSVAEMIASGELLSSNSASAPLAAAPQEAYFQVRNTLSLPRPNYLVPPKEVAEALRPVTPPARDIDEKEWRGILAHSKAARVEQVDGREVSAARVASRRVRASEAGLRWRRQHRAAHVSETEESKAVQTIDAILKLGLGANGQGFLDSLAYEARLTYCSNVRFANNDMVVVAPTAHTPRRPNSSGASRPATAGVVPPSLPRSAELSCAAAAASGVPQVVATTPRIGSGIAGHRPMKKPTVAPMRSLWNKAHWAYEAGGGDGGE